jgi:hypothetical protein
MISARNMWNTFGLVPIHGHDVWLHAVLGVIGVYFGFIKPGALEGADVGYAGTTTAAGTTGTTRTGV